MDMVYADDKRWSLDAFVACLPPDAASDISRYTVRILMIIIMTLYIWRCRLLLYKSQAVAYWLASPSN